MAQWKELMFQTVVTTADVETALTSFTPSKDARLVGVEIMVGGVAATSLVEQGYIKMTCTTFSGVDTYFGFSGCGVRTAPAVQLQPNRHNCMLPVKSGTPIKGYIYHNVTATTPEILVYGIFEA